jgi:ABC-2 type transport system permease protein
MWNIIWKEILEIRRDRISSLLLVGFCLLLFLAVITSWSYNKWYSTLRAEVTENARHHWETQGVKNSHSAAHFGIYLFKPLSVFSLWDPGIDKHVGSSVFIEAHKRNPLQFKAVEDNPLLVQWGELTPSYILLFLLPLLIMWLGSNSIVKERTNGTLRLVLSQGLSLQGYAWGKALTLWIVVAALILLFWFIGGSLMSFTRSESFFNLQGFLLLLAYIFFAGIFIHASLTISFLANNQRNALVILITVWFVFVWFVPKLITQLSERIYPSPTFESFQKNLAEDIEKNGLNGHGGENQKVKKLKELWTQKYGVDSIEKLPVNWVGIILEADEDTNNVIIDRHYEELYKHYEKQNQIHNYGSLLSPVIPALQASMIFSGTDLKSDIHFNERVNDYRKHFIETLNNRLRDKSRYNERDTGTVEVWKAMPVFDYQPPPLNKKWDQGKSSLLLVSFWLLASMALMQITLTVVKIL